MAEKATARKVPPVNPEISFEPRRERARRAPPPQVTRVSVQCAYCRGSGKDPFGAMSRLSTCPVCGGKGKVQLREPYVSCAFCHGTGVHADTRLTCTACGGKGYVTVEEPHRPCAFCQGTGVQPRSSGRLTCSVCGGRGVVTVKEPVETCPTCGGRGIDPQTVFGLPCIICGGAGVVPA